MRVPGGRTSITADMFPSGKEARREDSHTVAEVVEVMRTIPDGEKAVIFTYKDRGQFQFARAWHGALDSAGVDPASYKIATWGMETGTNDYRDCKHVILAGVIRRDRLDLQAAVLGQVDTGIDAPMTGEDVNKADLGEVLHVIYQAANRGSCRNIHDGQAMPMTLWIMHKHRNIETPLKLIMPGCRWEKWKPVSFEAFESSADAVAEAIGDYLTTEDTDKVSFRALRSALGYAKGQPGFVADKTWANGRKLADDAVLFLGWKREGNCYLREST